MTNGIPSLAKRVGLGVFPRPLAAAAGALLLAACQHGGPPALSLEEAKKVTATFEGQGFVPPPKTIADITAILNQQKRADPEAAEKARVAATAEPPPDLGGVELAKFYWDRGQAAGKIGDVRRQVADLKEAVRLSAEGERNTKMKIIWDLSVAHVLAGDIVDAIPVREQALAMIPQNPAGALIRREALLAVLYAWSGKLDAAKRLLSRSENRLREVRSSKDWTKRGSMWTSGVERGQAQILDTEGRYAEAETFYRSALRAAEKTLKDNPEFKYGPIFREEVQSELARNLVRQGRLVEAEVEARNALSKTLARLGRYSPETALMLKPLAEVIGVQGRNAEAEKLARAVIDIYQQTGASESSLGLAQGRAFLAETLVNQGHWQEALAEFGAMGKGFVDDPDTLEQFFGHNLSWALALLGADRAAEAKSIAAAALQRNLGKVGKKHQRTAEASGVLAMALGAEGERREALAEFSKAIPILLSRSRQADDETTTKAAREQRLGMILGTYIGLLADIRGTAAESDAGIDAVAEAFRVANVARGQSVQRALAASSARATAGNPELADIARREQDTEKQISALFGQLANVLAAPTDQQDAAAVKDLRTRIDQLRGARAALMEEIEARFPDYAELINPKPATIETARAVLGPGEALIATYVGEDRSYVWAVPQAGEVAFAAVAMGREDLEDTVALLRSALEPNAQILGDIPDFDVAAGYGLYEQLFKPVEAGWKEAKSLIVVAHGALGYLPLSLLPTAPAEQGPDSGALFSQHHEVAWLVRTHAVTVVPSVASLKTLRGLPPGNEDRKPFVGFGDPLFSTGQAAQAVEVAALTSRGLKTRGQPVRLRAAPKTTGLASAGLAQLPRLPDTADEVRSIAVAMNADLNRDVFLGSRANEGMVKSLELSGYRVLAFATHGLVPGDLDGLTQPALALSAPDVAGGGGDGLLTMGEILGLKLDADWVVLSAYNTGSGAGAGAEAASGLGRAFFYAGTRALLVSNWPVETTSAKALTTDLFRRQSKDAGLSRAQALRQAMLSMIDEGGYVDPATGKRVFSYAHPIFWAPFSLIGDGGGARPEA